MPTKSHSLVWNNCKITVLFSLAKTPYFFLKTLHLLGVTLLASALLGQGFLLSRKQKISSAVFQDLRRWTAIICYLGLLLSVASGLQMGIPTGLFLSKNDFWLRYKSGLFILFFLLVLWQQVRLQQTNRSVPRKRWLGALIILLVCLSLYISVAPSLFNNPAIVFEILDSVADSEEVEEVEEMVLANYRERAVQLSFAVACLI